MTTIEELTEDGLRARVAGLLTAARARSAALTDAVDDADLVAQHSPLMSPLVWDLAHIGSQEELWLVRDVGGREPLRPEIDGLYDAFQHSRASRVELPLLGPAEARAYVAEVRDKALDMLDRTPLAGRRLVEHGFAFGMIVQHEQQHAETMLATHQLRTGRPGAARRPAAARAGAAGARGAGAGRPVHHGHLHRAVGAGQRAAGARGRPAGVRDRRRAGHQRRVRRVRRRPAATPTRAGGARPAGRTGSRPGWPRRGSGAATPTAAGCAAGSASSSRCRRTSRWCTCACTRRRPTRAGPASGCPPRRSGRRPPASTRPPAAPGATRGATRTRRRSTPTSASGTCPPAPVGAYPAGASPLGVHQLIGDVWEWTSSGWDPYPGFEVFPYPEYSQVFFGGDYRVLRGGSFGTDPAAFRATFRNWDLPIRRQIFAGFRCARDVRGRPTWRPGRRSPACADTWPTWARRCRWRRWSWSRRTRCCGSPTRRGTCAAAAPSTPTASAPAGTRSRPAGADPVRYRSARPIWSDTSFAALAAATRTGALLAAVRSATVGMPVTETAAAPFAEGRWLFSHNGLVRGWPDSWPGSPPGCRSPTCSPWTPPPTRRCSGRWCGTGCAPAPSRRAALAELVLAVEAAAPGSRLNLLLTDGTAIWATAWYHALSVRIDRRRRARRLRTDRRPARLGSRCPTGTWWWPARATAGSSTLAPTTGDP